MATLQSRTGKATVQVSPDGFSVIFSNNNGLQIYWPASDWASAAQFIRREIERIRTDGFRPKTTDEEVDAEGNEAFDRMRKPRDGMMIPSPLGRKH